MQFEQCSGCTKSLTHTLTSCHLECGRKSATIANICRYQIVYGATDPNEALTLVVSDLAMMNLQRIAKLSRYVKLKVVVTNLGASSSFSQPQHTPPPFIGRIQPKCDSLTLLKYSGLTATALDFRRPKVRLELLDAFYVVYHISSFS